VLFEVLTPFTAMFTTGIAEITLSTIMYIYIKRKLKINYIVFNKQNILYILLSLLFIPISFLIKLINFGFWINMILIIVLCMMLYVGVLYIKKDENLFLIFNKLLAKVGRKI